MADAIAEECNRASVQELVATEGKLHGGPGSAAKERKLNDQKKFELFQPLRGRAPPKSIADTCWGPTRKMVDGKKDVKARLAEKGYQNPDLKDGSVDISRCVSLCSSHPQVIPLGALRGRSV